MNRAVSWFCKIFLAPLIKNLFIKEVLGSENIPQRNFILASNHQSHLDQLVTGYICIPRRFHMIGQTDSYRGLTKAFLYILYFIAGVIPVNRKKPESRKRAIKEAIENLRKGDVLIIYPEGTRTRTGEIGEGKFGVAKIFLATGVPILPVGIKGVFELLPPGGKLKIKKIITINIGQPLYFKESLERSKNLSEDSEEYKEMLLKITNTTMEKITTLRSEIN